MRAQHTVCWIQHGGEIAWSCEIAQRLLAEGIRVRFVSFLREMAEGYAAAGWPSDLIGEIFRTPPLGDAELARLERRYGPPALRCLAASDVHLAQLYGAEEAPKVQLVARALQFWERYFDAHGITAAIVRDQASLSTRTAAHVAARRRDVRMLQLGMGPDNSRLAIYDVDASWCWSELIEALTGGVRPLPAERVAAIEAFVASRVPPRHEGPMALKLNAPPLWRLPLAYWQARRAERRIDAAADPLAVAVLRLGLAFQHKRSVWRATRRLFRYDAPGPEPYVYFPLFHTEESGHLVNIRFWCRHLEALVAQAAEALPYGHVLVVKEHPAILGDVPRRVLRRMRRNHRVRIVAPETQSQSLIASAAAVLTLEGTVGWEALLMRRPVVVLAGQPFYVRCALIYSVQDVCALDRVLPEAVEKGARLYDERRDEWLWFIDCVLRSTPAGVIETYEFPHVTPEQSENLDRIAAALAHKIEPADPLRVSANAKVAS